MSHELSIHIKHLHRAYKAEACKRYVHHRSRHYKASLRVDLVSRTVKGAVLNDHLALGGLESCLVWGKVVARVSRRYREVCRGFALEFLHSH
jgi:hypothetical protein